MAQDGALGPWTLLSAMTFSVTLNFFRILPTKTDAVVAFPQIKENPYSSFVNLTNDMNNYMRNGMWNWTTDELIPRIRPCRQGHKRTRFGEKREIVS